MPKLNLSAIRRHIETHELPLPLDVLVVGAAGVGKSSTINALAGRPIARVGYGAAPETLRVRRHPIDEYLHVHDTAGLGDGGESDVSHRAAIARRLEKPSSNADGRLAYQIDLVLIVLDAGNRDLGTAHKLVSEVILNHMQPARVIVVINQANMAMKGRGWLTKSNRPNKELAAFLNQQAKSFKARIRESTGLAIRTPVHYSASRGYNVQGLLDFIALHLPRRARRRKSSKAANCDG